MNDFTDALSLKISALEDELEECEETVFRIQAKIEMLNELLIEEEGFKGASKPPVSAHARKGKKGRPKGSKNRKKRAASKSKTSSSSDGRVLLSEAELSQVEDMEGTDPEVAKRLSSRKFVAHPRGDYSYGPGVHPGEGKKLADDPGARADTTITVDDESMADEE